MKMESPLEVLSRAVSIVQSENKANSHPAAPVASSDSGIEDDMTAEYSPKPLRIKNSPKRDYDSDKCSRCSPERLLNAAKCVQKSLDDQDLSKQIKYSPKSEYFDSEYSHNSPGKHLINMEYMRRSSPRHDESNFVFSTTVIKSSPSRDNELDEYSRQSPDGRLKSVKLLHRSSSKDPDIKAQLSPRLKSSPRRDDFNDSPQQSPEQLFNTVKYLQRSPKQSDHNPRLSPTLETDRQVPVKHEPGEYKRASPSCIDADERLVNKKIKLEESEPVTYKYVDYTETRGRKSSSPKRCNSEPRPGTKPNGSNMNSPESRPVHILPRYMQSYPAYPPLFILTDKPTNYSKLMATYDSIFAPAAPPLLPPYLPPAYTKCNCGDKNCTVINPPKYPVPPTYKEKHVDSNEYGLPNVDEHFRKSLGERYEMINEHVNERPSSVDDHFAKALGKKWYSMDGSSNT